MTYKLSFVLPPSFNYVDAPEGYTEQLLQHRRDERAIMIFEYMESLEYPIIISNFEETKHNYPEGEVYEFIIRTHAVEVRSMAPYVMTENDFTEMQWIKLSGCAIDEVKKRISDKLKKLLKG